MRKLNIKAANAPAVTITREATKADELVYIAIANKPLKYLHADSRIAYIGTTKNGVS